MRIDNLHKIYFLGIGGIGMSALARYFNMLGINVSGYDRTPTSLTAELEDEGISIHYEEDINKIPIDTDIVIYTPAIPTDNKEFLYIMASHIPMMKRSQALGEITSGKFTIAVAGTHGKTSVSSIITHILKSSGMKVNAFVGGILKNYNSNFVNSDDADIYVVEADEFDRSFLELKPDIAVITAMDSDHLDIYGNYENLQKAFLEFSENVKTNGIIVYNEKLIDKDFASRKKYTYGTSKNNDACISSTDIKDGKIIFDIQIPGKQIKNIHWTFPGEYNMENALAASLVSDLSGAAPEKIKAAMESYAGVKRRFDIQLKTEKLVYIDDYAHHPEEIKACIKGVKSLYPGKTICGVFQPHLFSRTRDYANEFASSLEALDDIILLDIYPAREKPMEGIDSGIILEKIKNPKKALCAREDLLAKLDTRNFDVLLTLGAGDIDTLVKDLKMKLLKKDV